MVKRLGIGIIVVIFVGIVALLLIYNEDLPEGTAGPEADALAEKMLESLNYEAYQATTYLEWTFKNTHHFKWQKSKGLCTVYWKEYKVVLDLNGMENHRAFVHNFEVTGEQAEDLSAKAITYYNNDSFWLVAPFKVFDPGTERKIVTVPGEAPQLLVTYTQGGTTPGDSYLWQLDRDGKPESFKIWAQILPLKGLKASWEHWITTDTGVLLPEKHRIWFLSLDMGEVKTRF